MDWIWLIFVLFSVVAGLLEKLAKQKMERPARPAPGSPHPPGEGRFFLDEPEEKKNPSRPGERTWREVQAPAGRRPATPMSPGGEPVFWAEDIIAGPEEGWVGESSETGEFWESQQDEIGRIRRKPFPGEESREEPLPPGGWKEPEVFLSALVLAHVLKRPDFRTLPWQRRL
ncbi:MAG: hypothetical protein GX036_10780 [Firmicutes bacterium]|nr:hypothetical protein [Bacillota bacterium]